LPAAIGDLVKLKRLNLSYNQLEDEAKDYLRHLVTQLPNCNILGID